MISMLSTNLLVCSKRRSGAWIWLAAIVFQLEAGAASFKMAGEWRQISGSQFCDICRQENRKHTGAAALLGKDVAGFILN